MSAKSIPELLKEQKLGSYIVVELYEGDPVAILLVTLNYHDALEMLKELHNTVDVDLMRVTEKGVRFSSWSLGNET